MPGIEGAAGIDGGGGAAGIEGGAGALGGVGALGIDIGIGGGAAVAGAAGEPGDPAGEVAPGRLAPPPIMRVNSPGAADDPCSAAAGLVVGMCRGSRLSIKGLCGSTGADMTGETAAGDRATDGALASGVPIPPKIRVNSPGGRDKDGAAAETGVLGTSAGEESGL